jgi:tetratricopeptide (TPR) repeat protein
MFRGAIGEFETALADVDMAIHRDTVGAWYFFRGLIHQKAGRMNLAIADYNRAIELAPTDPAPYTRRGQLRLSTRNFSAAETDFSEAIRLEPENPENYILRGMARTALNSNDQAMADFSTAIALAPEPRHRYLRGDLFKRLGKYAAAIDDLNAVIEHDPSVTTAYLDRAFCHAKQRNVAAAREDLATYLRLGGAQNAQFQQVAAELSRTP